MCTALHTYTCVTLQYYRPRMYIAYIYINIYIYMYQL